MIEKEQEYQHRLQKTQMEIRSNLVTFKIQILITRSAGVFTSSRFLFIRGRLTEGLSLIDGGDLTAVSSVIFKTVKGMRFLKIAGL